VIKLHAEVAVSDAASRTLKTIRSVVIAEIMIGTSVGLSSFNPRHANRDGVWSRTGRLSIAGECAL
jgi:hypothetical protein